MATSPKEIVSEAIDRAGVAMKSPSLNTRLGSISGFYEKWVARSLNTYALSPSVGINPGCFKQNRRRTALASGAPTAEFKKVL
jgi:hypothetical protein